MHILTLKFLSLNFSDLESVEYNVEPVMVGVFPWDMRCIIGWGFQIIDNWMKSSVTPTHSG